MAIEKTEHKTPYFERQNPNMSTEFHSAMNQWIIDVKCPFYEEFLTLFEDEFRGEDERKGQKCHHSRCQKFGESEHSLGWETYFL